MDVQTTISNVSLIPARNASFTWVTNNVSEGSASWDIDFVSIVGPDAPVDCIISGTILLDTQPLAGVTLQGLPDGTATDDNGFYSATVSQSFSGVVAPMKDEYVFTPDSRTYSNVRTDQAGQDYGAQLAPLEGVFWPYDLNGDRVVNLADLALLGGQWLASYSSTDLARLGEQWLNCSDTTDAACTLRPILTTMPIGCICPRRVFPTAIERRAIPGDRQVSIRDTLVRNGASLWTVDVSATDVRATSTGHYNYLLTTLSGVTIHADGLGADVVTQLHYPSGGTDTLTWIFRCLNDQWDSLNASGFSYAFHFQSDSRPVHKLMEHYSFSLGGTVDGRVFATQCERYARPSSRVVTIDSQTQLLPWNYPADRIWPESRMAAEDALDYLQGDTQTFMRFPSEMALIFKNLYRNPGQSEITVKDWHVTALTTDFTSATMQVRLYDRVGPNAWIQARDHVDHGLYRSAGMLGLEQDPRPTASVGLASLADPLNNQQIIDWLAARAITRVHVWSRWQSDWSESCAGCGSGCQGLSHAIRQLDWARNKFNIDGDPGTSLAGFCELAQAAGIQTALWVPGGHLSFCSSLRAANPNWITYQPGPTPYDYVYTGELGANNWDQGFGDYMIAALADRMAEASFDAIWLDSFQVMGAESVNYGAADWRPNLAGAVDFVKQARQLGLIVSAETGFPLALPSSTGIYRVNDPDVGIAGNEWVAYQTNQYHCYHQADSNRCGYDPIDPTTYFRLLAYKAAVVLNYSEQQVTVDGCTVTGTTGVTLYEWDTLGAVGVYANICYRNMLPYMKTCRYLENDQGVLWYNDDQSIGVLWSFTNSPIDIGRTIATATEARWQYNLPHTGSTVTAGALKVARITFP